MSDFKRMDLTEFRDLGLVQEINRLLLHPAGMALSVILEEDGTVSGFGPVWDYRDDPEGMAYAEDDPPTAQKARALADLTAAKRDTRLRRLGFQIQPVEPEAVS